MQGAGLRRFPQMVWTAFLLGPLLVPARPALSADAPVQAGGGPASQRQGPCEHPEAQPALGSAPQGASAAGLPPMRVENLESFFVRC